jgi:hypothetical protein
MPGSTPQVKCSMDLHPETQNEDGY